MEPNDPVTWPEVAMAYMPYGAAVIMLLALAIARWLER